MDKRINPFSVFTLVVMLALVLPVLLQDGMFMDGVQYACVSRNLATGDGTFWFPWLSESWEKAGSAYFMEHPPLVYGIQSIFFRIFGDTMYTERIYSLFTLLTTAFLISRIWNLINPTTNKSIGWLSVFLWIITPVCFWSYQNNMQENTMGIFTLLATWFILKGLIASPTNMVWFVLGGLAIFATFLCKGLPGLFPFTAVAFYFICFKTIPKSRVLFYSAVVGLTATGVLLAIVLLHEPAADSLNFYFYERLGYRISSEPTVESRFYILGRLCSELIPMIIVFLLLGWGSLKNIGSNNKRWALFFLLLGLSGSLPLMLTNVQSGFYLVPAFPFFALSVSFLFKERVEKMQMFILNHGDTSNILRLTSSALMLMVLGVSLSVAGQPGREICELQHAGRIAQELGENQTVCTTPDVYFNWSLHFYLLRKYNITLDYKKKDCSACLRKMQTPTYEDYAEKKCIGHFVLYKQTNSGLKDKTFVLNK
ncbi:MAG: ArnT family glycosyltransferase [Flavobacteriales bacterium]